MGRIDHPWVDATEWPLLTVTYPPSFSAANVATLFRAVEAFYDANDAPFAWVVDVGNVGLADAKVRQVTAEHEEKTKDHKARFSRGTAFVIRSPLVRGIITAVFWIAPPSYPYEVFSTVERARDWAQEKLGIAQLRAQSSAR